MGINSVRCNGMYAETGKTEFGEGSRSASDFDGADLFVTAGAVAVAALGAAAIAVSLGGKEEELPREPQESAKIEYGPYHFNASGENMTIHSRYSNKAYQIELENIEHSTHTTLVPYMAGKVTMMMPIAHHDYTGHFNVTDMGTLEKTQLTLRNVDSADLTGNMSIHASVGSEIAELTVTEKYVIPLKE